MINCQVCRASLCALIDNELSTLERELADKHLATCESCRLELNELWQVEIKLKSTVRLPVSLDSQKQQIEQRLAEHSLVQHTSDSSENQNVNVLLLPRSSDRSRWSHRWSLAIFALTAACLTVMLVQPNAQGPRKIDPTLVTPVHAGMLVRATGPVELLSPELSRWQELPSDAVHQICIGDRLRTGPSVLCEIETPDKGLVRIDASAEVIVDDSNQFHLVKGRAWCRSSVDKSIQWQMSAGEFKPDSKQLALLTCPSSSELQCVRSDDNLRCDSNANNPAAAQLALGNFSCSVAPGESVSIDNAQLVQRDSKHEAMAKIWQLPLLAIDAGPDSELVQVLRPILSSIGMTKARHMNENQLRSLGPLAAIPLLAYATTESEPNLIELRRRAVWLAADLADDRCIPWLRKLANDSDSQIASKASEKLTSLEHENQNPTR